MELGLPMDLLIFHTTPFRFSLTELLQRCHVIYLCIGELGMAITLKQQEVGNVFI